MCSVTVCILSVFLFSQCPISKGTTGWIHPHGAAWESHRDLWIRTFDIWKVTIVG